MPASTPNWSRVHAWLIKKKANSYAGYTPTIFQGDNAGPHQDSKLQRTPLSDLQINATVLAAVQEDYEQMLNTIRNYRNQFVITQIKERVVEAIKMNAAINGGQVTPTELRNLIKQVTDRIVDGLDRRLCRVEDLIKERRDALQQPTRAEGLRSVGPESFSSCKSLA
jgi:hypothetical protein